MGMLKGFKEKLQAVVSGYLKPVRERFLIHAMHLVIVFSLGGFSWASWKLYGKITHGSHHESVVVHEKKQKYDTDTEVGLGESHIPQDILDRQDGVEEKGHDLKETESDHGRGLASLIDVDGEIHVDTGPLFYNVSKVAAGLKREDNNIEAIVEADLSFQVDSRATRAEMEARNIELKALLEQIIAEFNKQELLTTKGKHDLKVHIMSQLNFRLKSGQITDVLYSNFRIQ